jgi:Skp family chaperone for outer membrane proteins
MLVSGLFMPVAMASSDATVMSELEQQQKLAQQQQEELERIQRALQDSSEHLTKQSAEIEAAIKVLDQRLEENRLLQQQVAPKKNTNSELAPVKSK